MTSKSCKEIGDGVMLSGLTRHRSNLAPLAPSDPFLRPPMNPAGNQYDVSDRLLLCASSNMRNEVVVGSADHALYSVNVNDPKSRPVTMYGKTTGHTDWVTSVTHLPNGKVSTVLYTTLQTVYCSILNIFVYIFRSYRVQWMESCACGLRGSARSALNCNVILCTPYRKWFLMSALILLCLANMMEESLYGTSEMSQLMGSLSTV